MDYKLFFEKSQCETMILDSNLTIVAATDTYCEMVHRTRKYLIGRNVFDAFPCVKEREHNGVDVLRQSLEHVLATKKTHLMDVIRYDIVIDGKFKEYWWQASNSPIIVDDEVKYIVNRAAQVSELVRLRRQRAESLQELVRLTSKLSAEL